MKKKLITSSCVLLFILMIIYLQCCREVSVKGTMTSAAENGYTENVVIIANKLWITDKKNFAEEMVQRCVDNDFHEVLFSYDVNGYPNKLNLTIYKNDFMYKLNKIEIKGNYEQSEGKIYEYNIKDNPEKFRLKIQ